MKQKNLPPPPYQEIAETIELVNLEAGRQQTVVAIERQPAAQPTMAYGINSRGVQARFTTQSIPFVKFGECKGGECKGGECQGGGCECCCCQGCDINWGTILVFWAICATILLAFWLLSPQKA
ncbi:hypothetical protein B0T25DRAFT_632578 [Lasiosphaeria hispida]|uniref:Uncharacterized protein n=1 Tax=Lasiosphaeria hispida TaxID=260671 RepID=A0AAJ0HEC1_9PEZI|nr:hypothetical protein B0T25DRAFT_632578 [Lasiosphaeria hispida]